jgi:flagella basal body P-ring formation protein FlgA
MKHTRYHMVLNIFIGLFVFPLLSSAAFGKATGPDLQTIPDNRFASLFSTTLQESTGRSPDDIVVSRFKVSGNKPVPAGRIHFRVIKKRQAKIKRIVRFDVIIEVGGIAENRVTLSGWLEIYQEVVFAGANLKKGHPVVRDDLYLERVNIVRMPFKVLTDIESAVGLQCKRSIKAGTVLKQWMLERIPVVTKGDLVMILAQSTGVRVTVPGRIMETGYENQLVAVENTMSKKKVYAKVIDSTTVAVEY